MNQGSEELQEVTEYRQEMRGYEEKVSEYRQEIKGYLQDLELLGVLQLNETSKETLYQMYPNQERLITLWFGKDASMIDLHAIQIVKQRIQCAENAIDDAKDAMKRTELDIQLAMNALLRSQSRLAGVPQDTAGHPSS